MAYLNSYLEIALRLSVVTKMDLTSALPTPCKLS